VERGILLVLSAARWLGGHGASVFGGRAREDRGWSNRA